MEAVTEAAMQAAAVVVVVVVTGAAMQVVTGAAMEAVVVAAMEVVTEATQGDALLAATDHRQSTIQLPINKMLQCWCLNPR